MEKDETKKALFEIRDNRGNKRFFIDDLFDDTYAAIIGPFGYAVYGSLCRRADKKQKAWPGVDVMAKRLRMSRQSVFAGLEILEFLNIIKRDRIGKKCTNRYTLLATGNWRKDWSVMYASLTSSEVRLKYFTSTPDVLEVYASLTSIERLHKKGCTVKGCSAASADASFSKENSKCKFIDEDGKACDEYEIDQEKSSIPNLQHFCKMHQPMNCAEFVEWYGKSEKRYIRIISEWADTVKPEWETVAQWEVWAGENFKSAAKLQVFSDAQMSAAFGKLKGAKYLESFNLTTLLKNLLNANKQ